MSAAVFSQKLNLEVGECIKLEKQSFTNLMVLFFFSSMTPLKKYAPLKRHIMDATCIVLVVVCNPEDYQYSFLPFPGAV